MKNPAQSVTLKRRCAIYTRKSTDEGLDQEFNSLHAQREACLAYVQSQKSEGWMALSDRFDDGGYSGGTLERPALQRLIRHVEAGAVDVVVVYKIDRLTRSLHDFHKLIEVFDKHGVTFVSVTQSFNTTSSMGRLTLNMLLSFAQFEREVTAERIRDKIAASRRKGMWMGGMPPLGYDVKERKLVVNAAEAKQVRHVFERFLSLESATLLCRELNHQCYRTKPRGGGGVLQGNRPYDKTILYKILHNRVYIGLAVHKGAAYPGQHAPIIEQRLWDEVHKVLSTNARARSNRTRAKTPALLQGLIFGPTGQAMTPTHTRKKRGITYRYYVSTGVIKNGPEACPIRRVPAGEVEAAVVEQVRALLRAPEIMVRTWKKARELDPEITEGEVRDALNRIEPLWGELFPAEQARIVRLLVERVDVQLDALEVRLRVDGLTSVVDDLRARQAETADNGEARGRVGRRAA